MLAPTFMDLLDSDSKVMNLHNSQKCDVKSIFIEKYKIHTYIYIYQSGSLSLVFQYLLILLSFSIVIIIGPYYRYKKNAELMNATIITEWSLCHRIQMVKIKQTCRHCIVIPFDQFSSITLLASYFKCYWHAILNA